MVQEINFTVHGVWEMAGKRDVKREKKKKKDRLLIWLKIFLHRLGKRHSFTNIEELSAPGNYFSLNNFFFSSCFSLLCLQCLDSTISEQRKTSECTSPRA